MGCAWGILAVLRLCKRRDDLDADLAHHYPGFDAHGAWRRPGDSGFIGVRRLFDRVERLPADALTHTMVEQRVARWPRDYELLAQILEEIAVLVAEQRRPKPGEVRRPGWVTGTTGKTGIDRAFDVMMAPRSVCVLA
ncbi:hypothetical protein [Streptosporangium sandarakinum]|uniref:hypothetical protein n=1 Tax=Streptosporangium sandarakinum TaxID=1260955 RepID=UPI0036901A2B